MKKLSEGFVFASIITLTVFGYVQGVVVPEVANKYARQAAVAASFKTTDSTLGTAKSLQPCNPVQTKCGKLLIIKDAEPDSYQDFTFVHQTIVGYPQTFVLDDDASLSNPSSLSNFKAFYTAYNATYLVSEVVNPAYNVTINCVDPSGGTTVDGAIAHISIYNGESVTCTFKNVPVTTACTTPNTWIQKANVGGWYRSSAAGFSINGKGYIGTGEYSSTQFQDFWEYNPVTNAWTQKADFGGGPRRAAVGFSINGKGYMGTGYITFGPTDFQDFWEYNPITNIWTQKANFGGGMRSEATGFSIGSKGYVGLGANQLVVSPAFQDFWEYNPVTDIWTQKASYTGGRVGAFGFSIGTKGYIGSGSTMGTGATAYFNDFWEYNPVTDIWTQKANFGGSPRTGSTGFSIGNKGYAGTGYGPVGVYFNDFWEYNPTMNVWNQKANFGGGSRYVTTGFSIDGNGYIGTGANHSNPIAPNWGRYKDFWCYTP
jgi:hypothetical protein